MDSNHVAGMQTAGGDKRRAIIDEPSTLVEDAAHPSILTARGGLDEATRQRLRQRGWRQPPRDRRRLYIGLLVTLALHLLFIGLTYREMQPRRFAAPPVVDHEVLQVRLIDTPRALPTPPPPAPTPPTLATVKPPTPKPPPKPAPTPKAAPKPAEHGAIQVVEHSNNPAPAPASSAPPQLYGKDGAVVLPPPPAPAPAPGYVAHGTQGDTRILHSSDPVKYKATRFEEYFPPPGENALQAGLRHVAEPLLKKQDMTLPGGIHMKCSLLGGCQDPPSPPSKKDGDERLSLAGTPLTKDPHALPPPSLERCIALYRDEKPLPQGCPVDTPTQAVDAELRDRVHHKQGD